MRYTQTITNLQEPVKDQCSYGNYVVRYTNEAGFPVNWYFEHKKDAVEFYNTKKKEIEDAKP